MKIAIGSDHAGYRLKVTLLGWLIDQGYDATDLGTYSEDSVNYPHYGALVGRAVASGEYELGVAVCGSGQGICMAVNRVPGARGGVGREACLFNRLTRYFAGTVRSLINARERRKHLVVASFKLLQYRDIFSVPFDVISCVMKVCLGTRIWRYRLPIVWSLWVSTSNLFHFTLKFCTFCFECLFVVCSIHSGQYSKTLVSCTGV